MNHQSAHAQFEARATQRPLECSEPTTAARWAGAVAAVACADVDIKTVDTWASSLNMAPATLRRHCRAAGIRPRDSLLMGRMLRSLLRGDRTNWRPEDILDVIDDRTLHSVLRRTSLSQFWHRERPPVTTLFRVNPLNLPAEPLRVLALALDQWRDSFL